MKLYWWVMWGMNIAASILNGIVARKLTKRADIVTKLYEQSGVMLEQIEAQNDKYGELLAFVVMVAHAQEDIPASVRLAAKSLIPPDAEYKISMNGQVIGERKRQTLH